MKGDSTDTRVAVAGVLSLIVSAITLCGCFVKLATTDSLKWAETRNAQGLFYGLSGVAIAQVCTVMYQYHRRIVNKGNNEFLRVQLKPIDYERSFKADVLAHLKRPELLLLVPYLSLTWVFGLMPESYYNITDRAKIRDVVLQLLVVDFFTYCFHLAEHNVPKWYILGHKAHHKYTNPHLFNAFDATVMDTIFMILIPLFATAQICQVSCWSYVVFGMAYSTHFMLIHSEYEHDFDPLLKMAFVNTAADHHVHHKAFKYNYGHFFTIYDRLGGTYRSPESLKGMRMYEAPKEER